MLVGCKNCGGYFTQDELAHLRAPQHPWRLTPVGAKVLAENTAAGQAPVPCPTCGNRTLRARDTSTVAS